MTDLRSNNEFDSLESFFHERLSDASFAKAEGRWKQIEEELERMEKEKRKRRLFWFFFSGFALLGGMAVLWFFVLADKFDTHKIAQTQTKSSHVIATKETPHKLEHNAEEASQRSTTTSKTPQTPQHISTDQKQNTNEKINDHAGDLASSPAPTIKNTASTSKIQLAACSKKANPSIFKNVPYDVIEVEGKDGIIRYFAETEVNDVAIQKIHSAGFASAFVKKNLSSGLNSVIVKGTGETNNSHSANLSHVTRSKVPTTSEVSLASAKQKENTSSGKKTVSNDNSVSVSTQNNNSSDTKAPQNSVAPPNDQVKNESTAAIAPPTNSNTSNNISQDTANTQPANTQQAASETKTDSVPPVAVTETKKDSAVKKPESDSTKKTVAEVAPAPFTPEWAILLLAGPNIFTSQATSNLYQTSGESQPVSLNTEVKVQFRPIKLLSFSGGVNYTTYTVKQDKTFFRFNKYQTSDYVFYSAFGPMAAPMQTLLEGYSMQAPFDTFPCYYSQSSKLNMINIPLEANLHLLTRSRVGIYFGVGVNSSFALSQQSTLTLHKEHFDNNISYNKVTVNPFSLSLLFSLGCDVRIGKKLYLSFVPSYRYGVTNLSTTSGTTFSPAYFAGNAGLKFKF